MEAIKALRYPALAVAALCLPATVQGAEWTVQDALSLQLLYSDYQPEQGADQTGLILQAQPSITLEAKGRRLQLSFDYRPGLVLDATSNSAGDDVRLSHQLDASLSSELYRQTLFLDASATASLNSISLQGPITADGLVRNENQVQTYSLSVNPYTRHRLGGVAVLQNSYVLSEVVTEGNQAPDSVSHQITSRLTNANQSRPFGWSLEATHTILDYQDDNQDSNSGLSGGLSYRLDADWSFSGELGYQSADVRTSRTDTEGIDWLLGTVWTPNPRTQLNANFGASYFGPHWDLSLTHRSRRTQIALSYSRRINNAHDFLATNPSGTGLNPSLTNEDFLSDQARFSVTFTGRRTTLSSGVTFSKQDYELTGLKDWTLSWDLEASRRLSQRLSATLGVYWAYLDPNGPGDSNITQYRASLSRSLGRSSSIALDAQYRRQTGDSNLAYSEKRIGATFTTHFL